MSQQSQNHTKHIQEELDPELLELAAAAPRDSVLRPILMLMVLVLGVFIIKDWQEELAYYFSSSEPIELGQVSDFPDKAASDPDWRPEIPHNRYVSLTGIPIRRSLSKQYKYFKLIGGEIYIEAPRDDANLSEMERIQQGEPKGDTDRSYFEGAGRALSFSAMPKRYASLRQYYQTRYAIRFCADYEPREIAQLEEQRKELALKVWKKTYEEAPEEEKAKMTPEPSQEKLQELITENPVCVDAWLIQEGKKPGDHLWYVILSGVFAAFMLVDLIFLIRWVTRAVRGR